MALGTLEISGTQGWQVQLGGKGMSVSARAAWWVSLQFLLVLLLPPSGTGSSVLQTDPDSLGSVKVSQAWDAKWKWRSRGQRITKCHLPCHHFSPSPISSSGLTLLPVSPFPSYCNFSSLFLLPLPVISPSPSFISPDSQSNPVSPVACTGHSLPAHGDKQRQSCPIQRMAHAWQI